MTEPAPPSPRVPGSAASLPPIDIVGDLHGQYAALEALALRLGYAVDSDWDHPDGRVLLFVGDLVDRGPESLAVAERVRSLVERGQALCLMGNHEYNLVCWWLGISKQRHSNKETVEQIEAQRDRWTPVLDFFKGLPIALELPGLRVVHACWHAPSLRLIDAAIGWPAPESVSAPGPGPARALLPWLRIGTPFLGGVRHPELPTESNELSGDLPHAVLMKGPERSAVQPFEDVEGKERDKERTCWWLLSESPDVPSDRPIAIGHYWGGPPLGGALAPPHPSGTPELRQWCEALAAQLPPQGELPLEPGWASGGSSPTAVCVDFNGMTRYAGDGRGWAGALRWPEGEVVWASA